MKMIKYIISIILICFAFNTNAQVFVVYPINAKSVTDYVLYVNTYLRDHTAALIVDHTGDSILLGSYYYTPQPPEPPIPPPATDLADIHYSFDNNSADSSGNGYDAIETDMVYGSTNPPQGTHYGNFATISTLFAIPSDYILTSPFSVVCWVRQYNTGSYYRIMSPWYTNSTWEYWQFWLDGVLFDLEFRGYQNSTSTLNRAGTANSIWSAGSDWHQVVFTYDNGDVTIYYDGTLVTSSQSTWDTDNMYLNTTLYIGQYFYGDIDDFSLYSFILNQTQVTTLFSGGAGTILTP